ncbi:MAG: glycosyltransferase family 9 protein [Bacteroidota bacterium]
MQKILVIQTAFIGDVVLSTSLLEKLYAFYPDAQIDFLLRKGNEALLENHPFINKLWIWDKKNKKHKNFYHILKLVRAEKYDKVINIQRFASTGIFTAFSGANEKIGFDKNPFSFLFTKKIKHQIGSESSFMHEIDRNQLLIANFTDPKTSNQKLYPSENDFNKVSAYKANKYICIAPTSVWFTKQFPKEKWIEFINSIQELDFTIYLLGGKSDFDACQEIIKDGKGNIINLSGKLSFLQTAALMKDAAMNFVNDSAPMHIASSMNAPVTAIYCSTVPYFGFGPKSDNSHIIEIEERLFCRPCGLHGFKTCKKNNFACANNIKINQLKNILKNI